MNQETKDLIDQGKMLPLMEEFYTIQGEGYHTGKAAYFIRVGGCDIGVMLKKVGMQIYILQHWLIQ